jgi:hypothetical protein
MATAKEKRIRERLGQIKDQASAYAINPNKADAKTSAGLAEEAAGLGLELADLLDAKGKVN